ncbi:hypothetical protein HFP15_06660 [Amycolatopsis sp. K13G38]|uniref:DUF3558 domain-containing protein n=1 Tax=Amycolatopsis acididurans TaxID=2724524 RepID=A0ABX1IYG6_9PSEU|nr:hypothetical protein [Amycolatopsis acididurans]
MVLAAVLLTGLAGCADRPNDLETYYDPPVGSPASTTPPAAAPGVTGTGVNPAASAQNAVAAEVSAAVLTKDDLAREGVKPANTPAENGDCFNAVPSGDPRGASWTYSSGSSLMQQVTGYLDRPASDVLGAVRCDGQKLAVALPSPADAAQGWCQGTTCTVLLAGGHVLSGLQVTASSTARAADAVKSLVPLAAKKLPATSS